MEGGGVMAQGKTVSTRSSRLTVWAFLSNFVLWSLVRAPDARPYAIVLIGSYLLGATIGWIINPFFIPAKDRWVKSPYERLLLRLARAAIVGGLVASLVQCAAIGIHQHEAANNGAGTSHQAALVEMPSSLPLN